MNVLDQMIPTDIRGMFYLDQSEYKPLFPPTRSDNFYVVTMFMEESVKFQTFSNG